MVDLKLGPGKVSHVRRMTAPKAPTATKVSDLAEGLEIMKAGGQAVFDVPKGKGQVIVGATGAEFMPPNIDEEDELAIAADSDNQHTWLS